MHLTGDAAADALLDREPFALLAGMLLDQQMPMERAFAGPHRLAQRLGLAGFDPTAIAAADPDAFHAAMAGPPAVHRFPGAMATRVQALARHIVTAYDGDTARVWTEASTGADLLQRLQALPGFGEQKARVFLALLGKQRGVQPPGWREAAGPYGAEGARRSVADVTDRETLLEVRATKRRLKEQAARED